MEAERPPEQDETPGGTGLDAGWAPPESGDGPGPRLSRASTETLSASGERSEGPRLPVPLRPMTAGDVLDGAVAILKARPRTVFGVMAVLIIPYNVLVSYLQRDFLGGDAVGEIFSDPSLTLTAADNQAGGAAALVAIVLGPLTLSLAGVAVGYLVSSWYSGGDPSAGDVLRRLGRRSGVALVAFVVIHVLEVVGFFVLFLPALAVMALSVASSPIIGAEDLGPFASVGRAWRLAGRRFFPVLGLTMLSGLVVSLVGQVVVVPLLAASGAVGDLGWLLLAVGGSLAGILTTALQAGAATLIYLDLRVRTEGLDIELAAVEHFDARP